VFLSDEEKKMLDGDYGPGTQKAMSHLKTLGEALDAEKMVHVTSSHIISSLPVEYLDEMIEGVGKMRTMVSLMPVFDPVYWRKKYNIVSKEKNIGGVGLGREEDHIKNMRTLSRVNVLPTFSCTPYLIGIVPRRNDVCTWAGTSGQNAANSLFGARAPRVSVTTCLATGITGVVPYHGLLKPENRYAEVQVNTDQLEIDKFTPADYGALGYYVGRIARTRNVVCTGLPTNLTLEQGKYLLSPLTVDGACTLCHVIGVTPEAPTLEAALGNKKPKETINVTMKDIRDIHDMFTNITADDIKLVVLGCPHLTIMEIQEICSLLEGRQLKDGVQLMLGISNPIHALADEAGYIERIEKTGAIITNCCVSGQNPLVHILGVNAVATNSPRAARFFQTQTSGKCRTYYATTKDLINLVTTTKRSY